MKLPESISALTGSRPFSVDTVGLSGSQVVCFDDMILKIEPTCHNADNEQRMMAWLSERLPVPEILAFERQDGFNYLLMSRMPGRMLCSEDILSDGERITALMAEAYQLLWAADITGCPGDASLESKLRLAEQRVAALCAMKKPGRAVFLSMDALLYKMRPMAQFFGRFMQNKLKRDKNGRDAEKSERSCIQVIDISCPFR